MTNIQMKPCAIEQGLPQTLTVKGEKTRTNGGSSAKIQPQLQQL